METSKIIAIIAGVIVLASATIGISASLSNNKKENLDTPMPVVTIVIEEPTDETTEAVTDVVEETTTTVGETTTVEETTTVGETTTVTVEEIEAVSVPVVVPESGGLETEAIEPIICPLPMIIVENTSYGFPQVGETIISSEDGCGLYTAFNIVDGTLTIENNSDRAYSVCTYSRAARFPIGTWEHLEEIADMTEVVEPGTKATIWLTNYSDTNDYFTVVSDWRSSPEGTEIDTELLPTWYHYCF